MKQKIINLFRERLALSLTVLVITLLLIFVSLFYFGIRINFLINDELQINLEPLDKSILIHYNESTNLNFTIINDNFMFCKSNCEFKLLDLSNNNLISSSNRILSSSEELTLSYDLTSTLPGSGQIIYQFEVKCNNQKSTLCRTDESPRFKTSFISFNYDLTEQEKGYKQRLNDSLYNFFDELYQVDELSQQNNHYLTSMVPNIATIPKEILDLAVINLDLDSNYDDFETQASKYISLWEDQQYSQLLTEFSNIQLQKFKTDLQIQQNKIFSLIDRHNSIVAKINNFFFNTKILEIQNYFTKINFVNKTAVDSLINDINNTFSDVSLNNFENYSILEDNLDSITTNFTTVNSSYNEALKFQTNLAITNINKLKKILTIPLNNSTDNVGCNQIDILTATLSDLITNISINTTNLTLNTTNLTINMTSIPQDILHYNLTYCNDLNITISLPNHTNISFLSIFPINTTHRTFTLSKNDAKCCIFDQCRTCCTRATCPDQVRTYPIVFVHGHSFNKKLSPISSLDSFAKFQHLLQDEGIINAGEITLTDLEEVEFGVYGRSGFPVSLRTSYYYINFLDLGRYHITVQKSERIENYALRLKELLDIVKFRTGADKVNIVSHSMGGLVARQYISLFGGEDIHKLIMIATPNNGIRGQVQRICSFLGAQEECEDMSSGSIFLKRLKNTKSNNIFTIAGRGCKMELGDGDGVVYVEDVKLDQAQNFIVEGKCTSSLNADLHNNLLDPDLNPKVYGIVTEILKK